jgi:three-Cys-motif partner protein
LSTEGWLYEGREQSFVKHEILKRYLEQFAIIVGKFSPGITYVDCFSGPWRNRDDEEFQDTSFGHAITVLRRAREAVEKTFHKKLAIRCFFVEENASAYKKLKTFADTIDDAEVQTVNGTFEASIPSIVQFVKTGGRAFPFFFIDPTGWTGFALNSIKPLLQQRPSEALINFMTAHIRRFVEAPERQRQEEFEQLFGSASFREELAAVKDLRDREDLLLSRYMKAVRLAGGFQFACASTVLHPVREHTHFHLVYFTRDPKGVEVFKNADKKAMEAMEQVRAEAQQQARIKGSGNLELFGAAQVKKTTGHYDFLRDRYTSLARGYVKEKLEKDKRLAYDKGWEIAMRLPMVWESDLKNWIESWVEGGRVVIEGLKGKARRPRRGEGHSLVWKG